MALTNKEKQDVAEIQTKIEGLQKEKERIKNKPVVYGYARVSTRGQARDGNSLEAQENALRAAGAEAIYSDAFTGTVTSRPEWDRMFSGLKSGDTVIVTKLDRIARSVVHGSILIGELQKKGVRIQILNMGTIDSSPTGKLIQHIMLAFAEFEREMILQRTYEGKEIARKRPGYHEGRPKKYTEMQIEHALELLNENSYTQVVQLTGISKSTLLREKKKAKKKDAASK